MLKNLSAMQVMVLGSGRSSGKGNGYSLQYSCLENSMSVKEEREKAGLKLYIQKTKIMASGPITSWETDGETVETVSDFILGAPKSLQMVTAAMMEYYSAIKGTSLSQF